MSDDEPNDHGDDRQDQQDVNQTAHRVGHRETLLQTIEIELEIELVEKLGDACAWIAGRVCPQETAASCGVPLPAPETPRWRATCSSDTLSSACSGPSNVTGT